MFSSPEGNNHNWRASHDEIHTNTTDKPDPTQDISLEPEYWTKHKALIPLCVRLISCKTNLKHILTSQHVAVISVLMPDKTAPEYSVAQTVPNVGQDSTIEHCTQDGLWDGS